MISSASRSFAFLRRSQISMRILPSRHLSRPTKAPDPRPARMSGGARLQFPAPTMALSSDPDSAAGSWSLDIGNVRGSRRSHAGSRFRIRWPSIIPMAVANHWGIVPSRGALRPARREAGRPFARDAARSTGWGESTAAGPEVEVPPPARRQCLSTQRESCRWPGGSGQRVAARAPRPRFSIFNWNSRLHTDAETLT